MLNKTLSFLFVLVMMGATGLAPPAQSNVGFMFSVRIAPPPIPMYDLPEMPGRGYIWTPGYWSWDEDYEDYYWVPGTWVRAPRVGYLWTPGYWGWRTGSYVFYPGYWGSRVGYYGGINYGWGYFGSGYSGGSWSGDSFEYRPITNNYWGSRYSYNGPGGYQREPTRQELSLSISQRLDPISVQMQHERAARELPDLRSSVNRGKPVIAVTPLPGEFRTQSNDMVRQGKNGRQGQSDKNSKRGQSQSWRERQDNTAPPSTTAAPTQNPRAMERRSPEATERIPTRPLENPGASKRQSPGNFNRVPTAPMDNPRAVEQRSPRANERIPMRSRELNRPEGRMERQNPPQTQGQPSAPGKGKDARKGFPAKPGREEKPR